MAASTAMDESIEVRLERRGLVLPPAPAPLANYAPFVLAGDLLFLAGQGPRQHDGSWLRGKVGQDLTVQEGYAHARLAAVNLLAAAKAALGSLDRVERVVKLLGFVNAATSFKAHPQVIDGCSDLLVDVFGESGKHARSAVGLDSLQKASRSKSKAFSRSADP
jgi:enamine deaminase RidA (YjgF/YER057c/UK114 family)